MNPFLYTVRTGSVVYNDASRSNNDELSDLCEIYIDYTLKRRKLKDINDN